MKNIVLTFFVLFAHSMESAQTYMNLSKEVPLINSDKTVTHFSGKWADSATDESYYPMFLRDVHGNILKDRMVKFPADQYGSVIEVLRYYRDQVVAKTSHDKILLIDTLNGKVLRELPVSKAKSYKKYYFPLKNPIDNEGGRFCYIGDQSTGIFDITKSIWETEASAIEIPNLFSDKHRVLQIDSNFNHVTLLVASKFIKGEKQIYDIYNVDCSSKNAVAKVGSLDSFNTNLGPEFGLGDNFHYSSVRLPSNSFAERKYLVTRYNDWDGIACSKIPMSFAVISVKEKSVQTLKTAELPQFGGLRLMAYNPLFEKVVLFGMWDRTDVCSLGGTLREGENAILELKSMAIYPGAAEHNQRIPNASYLERNKSGDFALENERLLLMGINWEPYVPDAYTRPLRIFSFFKTEAFSPDTNSFEYLHHILRSKSERLVMQHETL